MEPQSLEQLLDCPVCFERLDGTNRVLPCQHTFCKRCLEKVKSKFKELRCPECRTKYTGSINELHCNILVMRILEQIKQSEKDTLKSKSVGNYAKHSNGKLDAKFIVQDNDRKNYLNLAFNSAVATLFDNSDRGISLYRTKVNRSETCTSTQQIPSNNNENLSSGNRVILGATRKQNRNREDGFRSSSAFARPSVPFSTTNVAAVSHSVRGNEGSAFSPNSYTFTVELKSDRNSNGSRRVNKNYVKPSILSAVSNSNVVRTPGNLFDTLTATSSNLVTPSTSQSISVFQSSPKNYLSFSPGSYTFNVNLKSTDRGVYKKKNYLS